MAGSPGIGLMLVMAFGLCGMAAAQLDTSLGLIKDIAFIMCMGGVFIAASFLARR